MPFARVNGNMLFYREVGEGPSRGGRRPILLEFRDDACVILGIEMGAAHVAAVLTDLRGRVLSSTMAEHPVREDPPGTRARFHGLFVVP